MPFHDRNDYTLTATGPPTIRGGLTPPRAAPALLDQRRRLPGRRDRVDPKRRVPLAVDDLEGWTVGPDHLLFARQQRQGRVSFRFPNEHLISRAIGDAPTGLLEGFPHLFPGHARDSKVRRPVLVTRPHRYGVPSPRFAASLSHSMGSPPEAAAGREVAVVGHFPGPTVFSPGAHHTEVGRIESALRRAEYLSEDVATAEGGSEISR